MMTEYQKIFLAYVKAIKARNEAVTEGDWYLANKKVEILKKALDRLNRK